MIIKKMKKSLKRKLSIFYGNRGLLFDVIVAIAISILILGLVSSFKIDVVLTDASLLSIIAFLGILAGFLLTAFSILYLYNPTESKVSFEFRKSSLFLSMLKAFLSTIVFIILSVVVAYIYVALTVQVFWCDLILSFLIILTVLRIIKCVYYLFVVVDIGNVTYKTK